MPKLPALKSREVKRILLRAGFLKDTAEGAHRTYYNPETDKHTTISFHQGDIPKGTLRAIVNQTGMSLTSFFPIVGKDDGSSFSPLRAMRF